MTNNNCADCIYFEQDKEGDWGICNNPKTSPTLRSKMKADWQACMDVKTND